jgi:hypothetical protein
MKSLASLQETFAAALRGAPLDTGLLRQRPNGEPPLFRIYQNAYASRLAAALRDNYPVLARAVGDEAFDNLAAAYVEATPSCHPSIRWYGDTLAAFMADRTDLAPHPALADLARMEWALRTAFDAADAPALTTADLAEVYSEAWGELRFALQPAAQRLTLHWSVEPVWRALEDFDVQREGAEPELPEPVANTHHVLVWRRALKPCFRSLDADEAVALDFLTNGRTFGELCAGLAERLGDEAASVNAASYLASWLADELLAG